MRLSKSVSTHLLILAALLLVDYAAFGCQQHFSPVGAPVLREPFTLRLRVDKQHTYEKQFDKVPYVVKNDVQLFAGDEFGANLVVTQGEISTVSYQPKHKRADIEFKFRLRKSAAGMMLLVAHNRFNRTIFFDAEVTGTGQKEEAKVLSFPADSYSYLWWPDPIMQLVLSNLRFSAISLQQATLNTREIIDFRNGGCSTPSRISIRPSLATGPIALSPADSAILSPMAWHEYIAGQDALEARDFEAAERHLKKAIDWPSSYCADVGQPFWTESFPLAHDVLGQTYLQQRKYKKAEAEFRTALQLDLNSGAALIGLGTIFDLLHDYGGAVKALSQGLQFAPDYYPGRCELAKAYIGEDQLQSAKTQLERVLLEAPNFAPAHELMGDVLMGEGHPEDALKEFETYLQLDPSTPPASGVRDRIAKIRAEVEKPRQK
jgi:tetratricopeptide (TPR) repeat protein